MGTIETMNEREMTDQRHRAEIDHAMEQKFVRPKYGIADNRDQRVPESAHMTIKPRNVLERK